jgi:hypothetical protein
MDRSYNTPVICCGCTKLGSELNKVSKALLFNGDYPNYSSGAYGLLLDDVSGLESEANNDSKISEVIKRTTDMLEKSSNVSSIALLNTLGTGNGLPTILLSEIKDNFPELSIVSILLTPTGGISGLSAINSLVTAQSVMEFSDHVMLRETDQTRSFFVSESSTIQLNMQTHTLNDIHRCIATDIFVALSSHWTQQEHVANSFLWPFDVCASSRKLFDVRSSLWRSLKQSSKSKTSFSPLRAVSSSIRSLHLWHDGHPNYSGMTIDSAQVVDLTVNHSMKCMIASHSSISASDVAVALEWATPQVSWPKSLGTASYRDTATGCLVKNSRTTRVSEASSAADVGQRAAPGDMSVVALSFQSPYARIALSNICDNAEKLIAVGAYAHRYDSFSCFLIFFLWLFLRYSLNVSLAMCLLQSQI